MVPGQWNGRSVNCEGMTVPQESEVAAGAEESIEEKVEGDEYDKGSIEGSTSKPGLM